MAKHHSIWAALAAPYFQKWGVMRASDVTAIDRGWPTGFFQTGDDVSGTVQNLFGINAGGATEFGNTNGNVFDAIVTQQTGGATAQTSASTTGITLSNANLLNQVFVRTAANSAQTDTTRTAAQLVAAIPGVTVGSSFRWVYKNASSNATTLGLGSGVTKGQSADSLTCTNAQNTEFLFVFTNVTASSEAVAIYTIARSAQ